LSFIKLRSYFDSNLEFQHYTDYTDITNEEADNPENNEDDIVDRDGVKKRLKRNFMYSDDDILQKFKEIEIKDMMSYNTV
jgi:hypothetical protein